MNVSVAALALPVVATLLASSASASTVILSPLGSAPQHVATLGHSCAVPNAPAQIHEPFFEYPTVAKILGAEGVAAVGVSLSPAGRVVRAWRIQSSGNTLLDRAALDSAHNSSYVAERAQCGAVAGDYKLEVEFSLKD